MAGATLVAAGALYGLSVTSSDVSPSGAYLAFFAALALWGWNELAFLLGHVTGWRRTPCPQDARGLARFKAASQSVIYHEILIILTGAAIAYVSWGGGNFVGFYTFSLLWLMRLSTKLNIFLGVPNIASEFLPAHLAYLKSYFTIKPMNALFPFSVTAATLITFVLSLEASHAAAGSFTVIAMSLLATLAALALIEHWFLVVPLPFGKLWDWGMASRPRDELKISNTIDSAVASETSSHGAGSRPSHVTALSTEVSLRPDLGARSTGRHETWPHPYAAEGAVQ